MRLSNVVLLALRGMDRDDKKRISQEMGLTEDTFYRWLRTNDEKLTMAACLAPLKKEFNLTDEQLLENESAKIAS